MKGTAGDPLPAVFQSLEANQTRFLRSQLALICAPPGAGKSAFILTYALRAKVPTLYFSADSDPFVQLSRAASIVTGWPLERTSAMIRSGTLNGATELLADIPIQFVYEPSPTLADIDNALNARIQRDGDFPALVIIDNVTNVLTTQSEEDPFSGLEMLMDELHKIARDKGSAVVGLHHVTGPYNNSDKPIPLSGVKGQIARVPELILSMYRSEESLMVSTLKNRNGRAAPDGSQSVELSFHGPTMQITDA